MKLFSAAVIVTTVALVCWTDSKLDQWEGEQDAMATTLLTATDENSDLRPLQAWGDLPRTVQDFLHRVVPNENGRPSSSLFHAVSLQQEGEFLMKKGQYVPFNAQEVISSNPLGFAWEGKIAMAPSVPSWFPKLFVRDSWMNGVGDFQAAVQALVPILCLDTSVGASDEMTLGQATRWLADAILLPTVLTPDAGMVTWAAVDGSPDKAILTMPIADVRGLQLEATFEDGLLTQFEGEKPFLLPKSGFETKTWQVNFSDYQTQENGMTVPMRIESGWINVEGDFEAYYKIDNRSLQYQSAVPTATE